MKLIATTLLVVLATSTYSNAAQKSFTLCKTQHAQRVNVCIAPGASYSNRGICRQRSRQIRSACYAHWKRIVKPKPRVSIPRNSRTQGIN